MSRRRFVIATAVTILIFVVLGIVIVNIIDSNQVKKLNEIGNSRNMSIEDYNSNLYLTEDYLKVYDVRNNSTYKSVKDYLYPKLSADLQDELFPTEDFNYPDLYEMKYSITANYGTFNPKNESNVFFLEYNLTGVNYEENIMSMLVLQNGKIQEIHRLK